MAKKREYHGPAARPFPTFDEFKAGIARTAEKIRMYADLAKLKTEELDADAAIVE